jgi:hypothetical protein
LSSIFVANEGALDLGILFRCKQRSLPLSKVCADLKLEAPTVFHALSKRASISAKTLKIVFRIREIGKSL